MARFWIKSSSLGSSPGWGYYMLCSWANCCIFTGLAWRSSIIWLCFILGMFPPNVTCYTDSAHRWITQVAHLYPMPAQVFCKLLRNQQGVNDQSGKPDTNESGMQTFMYSLPPHCRCPHVVHVALIFVFFVFITKWENKQMTCFFFETSQVVIRPLVCGSKENRF